MGQKELSMLLVAIIIAGIGILFSTALFSSGALTANDDAVRQDLASIASSAQAYYIKPSMLGGGGKSFANIDFYHIVFNQISFPYDSIYDNGANAVNKNGIYHIRSKNNGQVIILAIPTSSSYIVGRPLAAYRRIRAVVRPDEVIIDLLEAP